MMLHIRTCPTAYLAQLWMNQDVHISQSRHHLNSFVRRGLKMVHLHVEALTANTREKNQYNETRESQHT